jgi:hypothetical protein
MGLVPTAQVLTKTPAAVTIDISLLPRFAVITSPDTGSIATTSGDVPTVTGPDHTGTPDDVYFITLFPLAFAT